MAHQVRARGNGHKSSTRKVIRVTPFRNVDMGDVMKAFSKFDAPASRKDITRQRPVEVAENPSPEEFERIRRTFRHLGTVTASGA